MIAITRHPEVHVDSVRRIFDDGNHNAFTDMCVFRGRMYLAFRSNPISHLVEQGSSIVICVSDDGGRWTEIRRFGPIPHRDLRDPHFVIHRNTLFIYSAAWIIDPETGGHEVGKYVGYAGWTTDGIAWHGPQVMQSTFGQFIWRAGTFGDKAYLVGKWRRHVDLPDDPRGTFEGRTTMLESADGVNWTAAGIIERKQGTEVAFTFEDDGEIVAVIRMSKDSLLGRSRPPYTQWTHTSLGRFIGGPMLVKWAGRYLVGGRKFISPGNPRTVLSWLINDQLVDMVELPSGGDNSYTGFVPLSDTRALISYYSSHEGSGTRDAPCHIYLAEISIKPT